MKIQELIDRLEQLKADHGNDIEVRLETTRDGFEEYAEPGVLHGEHGYEHWVLLYPRN